MGKDVYCTFCSVGLSRPGPSGLGLSRPGPSGLGSSRPGLEIRSNYNRALQVVRNVRDHFNGTRAADEQKVNFAPYKKRKVESASLPPSKKCTPWSAKFVCLADTDARHIPSTVAQKEVLFEAGLGEKIVNIPDVDCSAAEFQQLLINAFPKLKHARRRRQWDLVASAPAVDLTF